MGRRVRGAVRAFPLECAPETSRIAGSGAPDGVSAASINVVAYVYQVHSFFLMLGVRVLVLF
jgi:hypothetical protein